MMSTGKLTGKTLFITGASRGIGKTIALKDVAKVVTAKRTDPHPEFFSSTKESALILAVKSKTNMKDYNLMDQKSFVVSKTSSPLLKKSSNPYIMNLGMSDSTISKCGISSSTLNVPKEFKSHDLGVNAFWNKTSVIFKKYDQIETTGQKRMMSSQAGDGGIEAIFTSIKGKLNADIVKSTQAVFQFNLTGDKEETYHIDLKNGEGSAGKGKPSDTPDATLTMNPDNFQKLFAGKLKATSAFMTGKLKISGNMQKAMKLEKLLTSLKK